MSPDCRSGGRVTGRKPGGSLKATERGMTFTLLSCSFSFFLDFLVFLGLSHARDDSHAEMIDGRGSLEEVRWIEVGDNRLKLRGASSWLLRDNKRGMRDGE